MPKKTAPSPAATALPVPTPLAGPNQPVDWLFAFKFNSASFPGCDDGQSPPVGTPGIFGGTSQAYPYGHSQQYVYATSASPALAKGAGCLGATLTDPLGATFAQLYNNPGYHYVVWNDQFYNAPLATQFSPWGHSKGMVYWDDNGDGMVLQVSTPSWPASGSKAFPRQNDGNTLGCIRDDDVMVSQHFFALKLRGGDLATVLQGLVNSSVVTDPTIPSIVQNGGPAPIQKLVAQLQRTAPSASTTCLVSKLSTGVQLISKPSHLAAPPWQLVSSQLGGAPLRTATWWALPKIYSTTATTPLPGWPASLPKPGPVAIATTGTWAGKSLGLQGGLGKQYNHAKIGVSTDPKKPLSIFGDLNQQGAIGPGYAYPGQPANDSQCGRGGTFYVVNNAKLCASLAALLAGETAPTSGPNGGGGKPGGKPGANPSATPASTPAAVPTVKTAPKPAAKPKAKLPAKPATKPAAKRTAKPAAKPVAKPAAKSAKTKRKPA
ncbi:MAG: hypothetical protein RLZZ15_161 [Verrucomicrobiota bacterium]|jgi:hypothetical protein